MRQRIGRRVFTVIAFALAAGVVALAGCGGGNGGKVDAKEIQRAKDPAELTDIEQMNVPVIFVTAYGEVESYMDLMNMGAFDYLNKPVGKEEMLKIAGDAIGAKSNSCV